MKNINNFLENLPNRKDETWKYTNLNFFFENSLSYKQDGSLEFEEENDFYSIRLKNTEFEDFENDYVSIKLSPFVALNFAAGNIQSDKAFQILNSSSIKMLNIHFKKKLDRPIKLVHFISGNENIIDSIIKVTSDVDMDLLEVFKSEDENKNLCNNLTLIELKKNQRINHTLFQDLNKNSMLLNNSISLLRRDSHYQNINLQKGSRLTRHNIQSELLEENATSEAHGLYVLNNDAHVDTNSFIYHNAPHTFSSQLYKTVLDDNSRGVFTGLIRVEKEAQKIESDQLNKNLLLSNKAQANSRPQLEIYADDVKCAHGSTTGQINEDELFYFTARGIDANKARDILAKAFINEVLFKIDNEVIKKEMIKEL